MAIRSLTLDSDKKSLHLELLQKKSLNLEL